MALGSGPERLREQAADFLVELIRINTVNPPGNERRAQELIKSYLEDAGMECRLAGAEPERQNLIATLAGEGPGDRLLYLGHIDTVLADPGEWSVDPFGGEVADGYVWGRGALDMKGQVAAEVVACAALARSGWRPARGELKLVVCCDEEVGGALGAQWLCNTLPGEVATEYLINEGGGGLIPFAGRRLYELCVGEKGVFRFRLETEGRAGHASTPRVGENALMKMVPLLERLRTWQPALEPSAQADVLHEAFFGDDARGADGASGVDPRAIVERAAEHDPRSALLLEPMLGLSVAPTMIRASEKANVIPARCQLRVDCRVPPGEDTGYVRSRIEEALGTDGYALAFEEEVVGNDSPAEGPLADAIGEFIAAEDPDARLAPVILPGFTDSNWFRRAFGCTAYGFFPQRAMDVYEMMPLIHGADERIAIDDLEYGARFFQYLAPRMLG